MHSMTEWLMKKTIEEKWINLTHSTLWFLLVVHWFMIKMDFYWMLVTGNPYYSYATMFSYSYSSQRMGWRVLLSHSMNCNWVPMIIINAQIKYEFCDCSKRSLLHWSISRNVITKWQSKVTVQFLLLPDSAAQ